MTGVTPGVEIRPLTGFIGAELHGLDLTAGFGNRDDDRAFAALRTALLDHHVVFVRGQFLGPAQLLEIAGRFGEILRNPLSPKVDGFPDVTELVTHDGGAPDTWHFDTSYAEVPPMASLLTMVTSPPVGGDTMWANAHALYDALSEPVRALIDQLSVEYESPTALGPVLRATHPLAWEHPDTGRRSLRFDPLYARRILGLHRHESDALLAFLRAHVGDPSFACRHRWEDGDFAMWDNRCSLHRVASDYVGRRVIHRVTVAG
jgi:taurine dioxygenase